MTLQEEIEALNKSVVGQRCMTRMLEIINQLAAELKEKTEWRGIDDNALSGKKVILAYRNSYGTRRTCIAIFQREGEDEFYDGDDELNPEGWYEQCYEHEEYTG